MCGRAGKEDGRGRGDAGGDGWGQWCNKRASIGWHSILEAAYADGNLRGMCVGCAWDGDVMGMRWGCDGDAMGMRSSRSVPSHPMHSAARQTYEKCNAEFTEFVKAHVAEPKSEEADAK